ncbi:hypothetical protein BD309DRAFT_951429 [Dichomitus squalens]|uniref:Uncharacterized protein n=1 Tax=Dichomitus squalens TaxID=114155 RepID=A0A4Q9P0D2_9APHY|nr:hypothetical protein BD311DRAFT_748112 [Dichomitus squalens]TBU47654.1 hypothetical protein BD309DRAFT_951429 [Dichomitus squalens]
MSLSSLPHTIWHLYVDNLVNYKADSWVHSIAYTCRLLAFALIVPFILLTLLDVASYLIARTLGVIDETKASTSGENDHHVHADTAPGTLNLAHQPRIVIQEDVDTARAAATPLPEGDDDTLNLKLSGVDTFSPAPSQPGSPTLQRREFMQHQYAHYGSGTSLYDRGGLAGLPHPSFASHDARGGRPEKPRADGARDGDRNTRAGDGTTSPRGPSGHSPASSNGSSGEESYAILDRDAGSGTEDAGTVVLRRRTRQTGTAPGAGDGAE